MVMGVMLSGCASSIIVPRAVSLTPIRGQGDTKKISIKRIHIDIPRGQSIGSEQGGTMCIPQHELRWQMNISEDEFKKVVYDEFRKADYSVEGDPNNVFEDDVKGDLILAGRIYDIKTNICYPYSGLFNYSKSRGETFISVEWQLYNSVEKKIVLKLMTDGFHEIIRPQIDGDKETVYQALANAVRNLLGKEEFFNLISKK